MQSRCQDYPPRYPPCCISSQEPKNQASNVQVHDSKYKTQYLFEVLVWVLERIPLPGGVLHQPLDLVDVLVHGVSRPGDVGLIPKLFRTNIVHARDTGAVLTQNY